MADSRAALLTVIRFSNMIYFYPNMEFLGRRVGPPNRRPLFFCGRAALGTWAISRHKPEDRAVLKAGISQAKPLNCWLCRECDGTTGDGRGKPNDRGADAQGGASTINGDAWMDPDRRASLPLKERKGPLLRAAPQFSIDLLC
jgi:hypothetical protein